MSFKFNLNILKRFILLLAVPLLIYYLYKNYNELKQFTINVDYIYLPISFLLLLAASIILPVVWYLITKNLDCSLNFKETIRIRLISEIGKYIPGRVFGYGYLIIHYTNAGKDQLKVLNSSVYELYLATFSSFLFFTIIHLFTSFEIVDRYKLIFIIVSILGILSLHPILFQKISDIFCKIIKKERLVFNISYARILVILLSYTTYWLIFSLAFFFFVRAFTDIHFTSITYISGSFAISTFAGFLAFFMPAGLGAREGVLIYLLSILTGNSLAIIISISSRIWIILGDIVWFFGAILSGHLNNRNTQ
jgi:hypothetical protein